MKNFNEIFIAAGCKCTPNVVDWCYYTNHIIFAVKYDIALITEEYNYNIVETALAHSTDITCLKFLKLNWKFDNFSFTYFLTGSSNGEICLWQNFASLSNNPRKLVLKKKYSKLVDELTITNVNGVFFDDNNGILFLSNKNKLLYKTYNNFDDNDTKIECYSFSDLFVLCFDIVIYKNNIIIAIGLTNGSVNICHLNQLHETKITHLTTLKHQQIVWCRDLKFSLIKENSFMLAAALDGYIKIWNFEEINFEMENKNGVNNTIQLQKTFSNLQSNNNICKIAIELDSVLHGHENWIYSLRWHPTIQKCLLSTSMDKNVILWQPAESSENIWLPKTRLGEIGGEAVGFYDAIFSPKGNTVLYHSFFGAFYLWNIEKAEPFPYPFYATGHFDEVSHFDWELNGNYLISCSLDKTTRIFAPLNNKKRNFFEIARPQIHGHSLTCIKSISSVCFISGAEEKIFRVFQAPLSFVENFKNLCNINLKNEQKLDYAALLSALGLSNKAILTYQDFVDSREKNEFEVEVEKNLKEGFIFLEPPQDNQLSKYGLFPEIQKLYGHGFEVYSVTSNNKGSLIATSCKASQKEHAFILIWDTVEWKSKAVLMAHQLTVTGLAFSPCDRFLLSVSRDRTWNLFYVVDEKSYKFNLCAQRDKSNSGHNRIIWSCAWSHNSKFFVTVSRDKILNIWEIQQNKDEIKVEKCANYIASDSITAVDFAPNFYKEHNSYVLAIGYDNGGIVILNWNLNSSNFTVLKILNQNEGFSSKINKLRFRPNQNQNCIFEFACCSANNILKIFQFTY